MIHHRASSPGPLEALLANVPFFKTLDRVDIARLIGALDQVRVEAGRVIFREGAAADALYLLERGRVLITMATPRGDQRIGELAAPAHFGDQGLLLDRRTATVRAMTDVDLWKLPRHRFEQLVRERPTLGVAVGTSLAELLDRSSREHLGAPPPKALERATPLWVPAPSRPTTRRLLGAVAAVGVPLALWFVPPPAGLATGAWRTLLILLGAALAWLFDPVPDFVIALAMACVWSLTGLAPVSRAFAGFASSTWLVGLGALGLAAAMARSGLPFRIALFMIRTFPATHLGQTLALLCGGVLLTPLVPLGVARVASVAPLTQELADALGYPRGSRAGAALAFAGLVGYGGFGTFFLTGLAINFFILDLIPVAERARFGWVGWLAAAAPVAVSLFAGILVALRVFFAPESAPRSRPDLLSQQRQALGPVSRAEFITLAGLAVLLGGLLLQPLLRVDAGVLAVASLVIVLAGGVLDREGFRSSIEWGLLVLFGILIGTGDVLRAAGIDRWIAGVLIPLAGAIPSPGTLILSLGLVVIAFRLVLPWLPTVLLLSLALIPAASGLGVSPWIVGFVVLTAAGGWFHPNQSEVYRVMRAATKGEMFTQRQGITLGIILTVIALLGIVISIPYWSAIGLIPR